ncbi:hypothetical protein BDV93DRAFT_519419 [Ceratobasidium sp. AG-I]|nr:hypothetical protein BDV93DRAFT_519419 [Ceratobasidium sp. AG-I]
MADPAVIAAALHELETAMGHIFASRCLAIAGVCILCYDYILTFPEEVELVWKQKWSMVSTIFVVNRYVTPMALVVDIFDKGGLTTFLPRSFCVNWYYGEAMWNLVSFGLIHALVALRVHAIWGRPRWLTITLVVLYIIYFVMTAVISVKFQIQFADTVAYNPLFRLCFAAISPYLWTCWLPALVFESFVFILTVVKAIEHSKSKVNTPVINVLYRDGIIYFVVICCCSMLNMMVWLLAPPTLVALSKYFVLSVVPTMGARLVLNLRGSRREDVMPTGGSTTDNGVYEMHAKGGTSSKSLGDRVLFVTRGQDSPAQDHIQLSLQERTHLNQMKSSQNYYRVERRGSKTKGMWNV